MEDKKGCKRKRRKSLLARTRKHGRGENSGGVELEDDVHQYFHRILETYQQGFSSEEERGNFIANVFDQVTGNEISYSGNQLTCRVLEDLMPEAGPLVLTAFVKSFGRDLRRVCEDRFASHVMEKLLEVVAPRQDEPVNMEVTDSQNYETWSEFVLQVGRFLLNNLEDYVSHPYANHVTRKWLACVTDGEAVKAFAARAMGWPHLKDLPYSELPSGFLQGLLEALDAMECTNELTALLTALVNDSFSNANEGEDGEKKPGEDKDGPDERVLPAVFSTMASVRLLEKAIEVAPAKKLTQIYAKCFINRLAALSLSKNANFAVQKLLKATREPKEFEAMYDELNGSFAKILEAKHTGVLLALADGCLKYGIRQADFVTNMTKCLDAVYSDNDLAMGVLTMERRALGLVEPTDRASISLHGSLLVQAMLRFKKPIKIVDSLLAVDANLLCALFCDPRGSHIADAFTSSQYIGEKSRERMLRKLRGHYVNLATTKHGSRCFEALWGVASVAAKYEIAGELCKGGSGRMESGSNLFGRIIGDKIALAEFRKDRRSWGKSWEEEAAQAKKGKKGRKEMFKGVIGE